MFGRFQIKLMAVRSILLASFLLLASTTSLVRAEISYQQWLQRAVAARRSGNYETALRAYAEAANNSPNGPNGQEVNDAIAKVIEERLASLQRTHPNYVRYIRAGEAAYGDGNYEIAIQNYRRALREKRGDRYANLRIRQARCILDKKPATGSQFRVQCPGFDAL
jgi:tetratricopeptide (TPR) repeat protein